MINPVLVPDHNPAHRRGTSRLRNGYMIEPSGVDQAKKWGYVLLAPHHPHCPGHAGLVFALHRKPKGAFFEPESAEIWIRDDRGLADWTRIGSMPQQRDSRRVCPGPVVLHDPADERAYFLTFGGSLAVVVEGDPRLYALHSPAPILELGDPTEPDAGQLAVEAEALLGRLHARWGRDDVGFLRRLAQADPLPLYAAVLQSLTCYLERSAALRRQSPELYSLLRSEKHWLQKTGRWPDPEITLEEMLTPGGGE